MTTIFISINSFAQDDLTGRPNPGCTDCSMRFILISGGVQSPPPRSLNPIATIYIGQNKNKYSRFIGLKYSQTAFVKNNNDFEYKTISLPIIVQANLNPYISIGGGVEGNYLLSAKINTKALNKQETKQTGFGLIADAEFGFPNRGPRLGVSYTRRFNTGEINNAKYGYIDLTLRVQIWDKKKIK